MYTNTHCCFLDIFVLEMRNYFAPKKLLFAIIAILVLIQFIQIDTKTPVLIPGQDISEIQPTPPSNEVMAILKRACYDCHSNTTAYPWYSHIAPVNWWLQNHVREARKRLNFSIWKTYPSIKKDKKLAEAVDLVLEGEMPLFSYTLIHKSANLSGLERKQLTDFFRSLRTYESEKND